MTSRHWFRMMTLTVAGGLASSVAFAQAPQTPGKVFPGPAPAPQGGPAAPSKVIPGPAPAPQGGPAAPSKVTPGPAPAPQGGPAAPAR